MISARRKAWQQFMATVIGRTPHLNRKMYVVRGQHYEGHKWWWDAQRHVRHTIEGIVKQTNTDNCMNQRHVQLFEIDFEAMTVRRLYDGKIK